MNKKKIFFIFFIFLIISILILGILLFNLYTNKKEKILLDNNNQIKLLCEIYDNFLKYYNTNIVLDESALRNFITNEEFDAEGKELLKKFEKHSEDSSGNYIMSVKYNSSNKVLTTTLFDYNTNKKFSVRYTLKPNFFEIKYISPKIRYLGNY
jgi:Na+-transporting NADH:ubiquinone oxidoreductase subunit NqrC